MRKDTRLKFDRMCADMAATYGVGSVSRSFAVEPTHAQAFRDKIVEQSSFLPRINTPFVDELEGENIFGSASGPASGRTDTSQPNNPRVPKNLLALESAKYRLHQTNFDFYIRYATIDAWAKFPDLAERYTSYVFKRRANDIELIGWYGVTAAPNTNLLTNPIMQDVNKGWMEYMRENRPGNILPEGATSGELRIGHGGDYINLDLAVEDLKNGIPPYLRDGLVALVGEDLVARERAALFRAIDGKNTEKVLYNQAMSTFGGLPWDTPSNFPARGLVVTSYANLSYYQQEGKQRRHIKDDPEYDRIVDFNSNNDGYVVEEPRKFMALDFENVKLPVYDSTGEISGWA